MTLKPQGKNHIGLLDAMRGIAIMAVFLFHLLGTTFGTDSLKWKVYFADFHASNSSLSLLPVTYGWAGVAIFFVVSGFCIHLSHIKTAERDFRGFFIRRFFRIYPPYLLCLFIFFFVPPWGCFSLPHPHILQLLVHVFNVHNFNAKSFYGINPSFWSIAVEVQLYAIYPLLLWIVRRIGWNKTLAITALVELGLRALQTAVFVTNFPLSPLTSPAWFFYSPFSYWFSWSIGAYVADCWSVERPIVIEKIYLAPTICAAFASQLCAFTVIFSFPLFATATAVACSRLLSSQWSLPQHGVSGALSRHFAFLGTISYSFYLIHQPLLEKIAPFFLAHSFSCCRSSMLAGYFVGLFSYIPIMLLSYICYRWVEVRSIGIGKRFQLRGT